MLPDWVEERVKELGADAWDDQARAWKRIAIIGELWGEFSPRSQEHKELIRLISDVSRRKRATQAVYARLWGVLMAAADPETGEIPLPTNVDHSTVRYIVEHGGDYVVIEQANRESWTLAQAKLWGASRTRAATDKPRTCWKSVTPLMPKHITHATGHVDEAEAVYSFREAIRAHNQQVQEETTA